jgi:hypothetical protein
MTNDQIRFIPGQMVKYISTRSFQLGSTPHSVMDGMEILFDGTNVELNGNRFVLPTLRGAIRVGWLVRAEDYDPNAPMAPPQSANIGIRPANDLGSNPLQPPKRAAAVVVESDERVVMSRTERNAVVNQRTIEARSNRPGAAVVRGNAPDVGGAEFGVEVQRTLRTPAKNTTQVTPNTVGTAIRDAELVKIQPGEGVSEEELLSRMSDGDRQAYLDAKESRKSDVMSRTVGYVPPQATTTNLAANNQPGMQQPSRPAPRTMVASETSPTVVGRVAPNSQPRVQEGISMGAVSTGGGTEIFEPSSESAGGKPVESTVVAEGMVFRNTNGPRRSFPNTAVTSTASAQASSPASMPEEAVARIDRDGTADARRKIAKSLCKDFPEEYNFSDHWKRRLAMVRLHFEDRPDIIRAIFAAESDDFKRVLVEEFPEAFPS